MYLPSTIPLYEKMPSSRESETAGLSVYIAHTTWWFKAEVIAPRSFTKETNTDTMLFYHPFYTYMICPIPKWYKRASEPCSYFGKQNWIQTKHTRRNCRFTFSTLHSTLSSQRPLHHTFCDASLFPLTWNNGYCDKRNLNHILCGLSPPWMS